MLLCSALCQSYLPGRKTWLILTLVLSAPYISIWQKPYAHCQLRKVLCGLPSANSRYKREHSCQEPAVRDRMHPDLSPHLHTERCNAIIRAYHQCHKDYPFKKFIGQCNDLDRAMNKCLKAERIEKRRINQEHAKRLQEKIRNFKLTDDDDL